MTNKIVKKMVACMLIMIMVIPSVKFSFATSFTDVKGHWAEKEIEYMKEKGIINGVEKDKQFMAMPDSVVTRAQYVTMILTSKGIKVEEFKKSSFADIKADHWALNYIETAKKNGIINGYEDHTFKPNNPMTRAEMVTSIVNVYNLKVDENKKDVKLNFEDVDSSHWAYKYIKIAVANDLIKGIEMNKKMYFKPSESATRAQAIVVLAKHIKKEETLPKKEEIKEESKEEKTSSGGGGGHHSGGSSSSSKDISLDNAKISEINDKLKEKLKNDPTLDSSVTLAELELDNFKGSADDISFEPVPTDDISVFGTEINGSNSRSIPGLTGSVFEFETNGKSFASAKLTLDVSDVTSAKIDNIEAVYYNETNNNFEFLPTTIDKNNKKVSFTTNHNSKYFLIDKEKWEETWRKELTVANSVYNGEYIDFAFIIDSSGSMGWNDRNDVRKKAVNDMAKTFNFDSNSGYENENVTVVKSVYKNSYEYETVTNSVYAKSDRATIIDFDSSVRPLSTFTADKETVADAVYFIDSSGGTNIFAGVEEATVAYAVYGKQEQRRIAILLTDGENGYDAQEKHWNIVRNASEEGIIIITMGLGQESDIDVNLLQKISQMTGGQYYQISTAAEIDDKFEYIQEHTQSGKDTDKDGITDMDEIMGLRLKNGMMIYTDPENADTDGDGVADGVELGTIIEITIKCCDGTEIKSKAYDFVSLPDDPNSK